MTTGWEHVVVVVVVVIVVVIVIVVVVVVVLLVVPSSHIYIEFTQLFNNLANMYNNYN